MMNSGKVIRLLRTAEGLKQTELAKMLGITRAYLSQVENGKRDPGLGFFKVVAKTFQVPLALLLAEENEPDSEVFAELQKIFGDILMAKIASGPKQV